MPDFQPADTSRIQVFAIAASVLLLLSIFELIRRGKLREEYSLVWLGSAILFLFFSVFRGAFEAVGEFFGIAYRPALLILVTLSVGFVLMVRFSVIISRLTAENKRLAQEMAILRNLVSQDDETSDTPS